MLGLKKKGGVKICRIQGEPFGLRGVKLSRREFGFRRRKGPLLALDSTNFQNFSPAAPYLKSQFSKKFTCSRLSPFSENNMVNTVK